VQKQGSTSREAGPRQPWSPLTLSFIAVFLPAGAAVLTVLNIARMQPVRPPQVRRLALATMSVFAVGLTALFLLSAPTPSHQPGLNSGVSLVLSLGTAVASYVAQRAPYRAWRISRPSARTSGTLSAIAWAAVYTVATALIALAVFVIVALAAHGAGKSVGGP
jgi:hypothetical protein